MNTKLKILSVLIVCCLGGCATQITSLDVDTAVKSYKTWQIASDYYYARTGTKGYLYSLGTGGKGSTILDTPEAVLVEPDVLAQYEEALLRSGLPERELEAARLGRVYVGMSSDGAIAAWGRPGNVNRTTTAAGSNQQWVYYERLSSGLRMPIKYLYFEHDRITAIQE